MFKVPELSYSYDALEPYIDAQTMEIHLTKHHQTYVNNLNKALEVYPELQLKSLEDLLINLKSLPNDIQTAVQNNAGGHYNHSLFWKMMGPDSTKLHGRLLQDIEKKFGSFEQFQQQFETAAKTRFGSGWAWLALDGNGDLQVYSTANQDATLLQGSQTILGLDVWEHAYYLNYQNRRPDYIAAWWHVVDWDYVQERYLDAIGA